MTYKIVFFSSCFRNHRLRQFLRLSQWPHVPILRIPSRWCHHAFYSKSKYLKCSSLLKQYSIGSRVCFWYSKASRGLGWSRTNPWQYGCRAEKSFVGLSNKAVQSHSGSHTGLVVMTPESHPNSDQPLQTYSHHFPFRARTESVIWAEPLLHFAVSSKKRKKNDSINL